MRVVAPFPPGSAGDIIPRALVPGFSEALKQTLFVENRPGAAGAIAAETVAKIPANGTTLLFGTTGTLAINPALYPKLPYDPQKDFAPIVLCTTSPHVIIVAPSLGVTTLQDYVALARSKPDQLNLASSGSGTAVHLSGELFNTIAGIKTMHVPYKGGSEAITDMVSGRVHIMFASLSSALPFVRAGKVTALAITSARRHHSLRDLPTVQEAGVEGYDVVGFFGLLAPAATPAAVINRLNEVFVPVLKTKEAKDRLATLGVDVAWSSPDEFTAQIREELAKWTRAAKGMRAAAD